MLEKNKKSAILLSAITVLSFSTVNAIGNILIPYLTTGNLQVVIAHPENLRQPSNLIALILILGSLLLALVLIGAYWLDRFFGEKYFGVRGAFRWALFGALFALFMMAPQWILPDTWRLGEIDREHAVEIIKGDIP